MQAKQPSSKTKAQQSRMRTLSNARKTLASMQTLADAMSSVQGQHLRPPDPVAGDGVAPAEGPVDAAASGPMVVASGAVIANGNVMNGPELEVEVFKDLVRPSRARGSRTDLRSVREWSRHGRRRDGPSSVRCTVAMAPSALQGAQCFGRPHVCQPRVVAVAGVERTAVRVCAATAAQAVTQYCVPIHVSAASRARRVVSLHHS